MQRMESWMQPAGGALEQIEQRRYEEALLDEGVDHILKYGIAFYKKRCRVMFATDAD